MYSIGDIVVATNEAYGSYIGEVEELIERFGRKIVKIRIKACLIYPLQRALYQKCLKERKPYAYGEVTDFIIDSVACHYGIIPDYRESVLEALEREIENSDEKDKIIYRKHLKELLSEAVLK